MIDLRSVPSHPGVYIFRDNKNNILYVGKAINLKNRVSSYFKTKEALTTKTRALVTRISNAEYIIVENEIEALLVEAELIKKHTPPYNVNLKDDKFYKYIKIYKDKNGLYTIGTARRIKKMIEESTKLFGPYPEGTTVNIVLKTLRQIFPYKDCSQTKFVRYQKLKRPCLYGDLKICPAPCVNKSGRDKNNTNVRKIIKYLEGNRKELFINIEKKMKKAAKEEDYEKAAYLRDQIRKYEYISQKKHDINEIISNPNLIEDFARSGLEDLLKTLKKHGIAIKYDDITRLRIEIYDISNFQGYHAVGAMVVLTGGIIDKKEYRKFKIKSKKAPDDYTMMKEMLLRRFKNKNLKQPNLIVVDGGKGQLSSALQVMNKLNNLYPTIGLAKKQEEIIFTDKNGSYKSIKLSKHNKGLQILIKGRDEAHRFGINYYRALHRKEVMNLKTK